MGFNTQPPEGGWLGRRNTRPCSRVSTHSRPKAAGRKTVSSKPISEFQHTAARRRLGIKTRLYIPPIGFNTQPPEGGWSHSKNSLLTVALFQHTAARRRLVPSPSLYAGCPSVSTHSRPKAAGILSRFFVNNVNVSTHSRPKAAG